MTLKDLARTLKTQATPAPHLIRIDDTTLGRTGVGTLIDRDLRRTDGAVWLIVDPATIPDDPGDTSFSLNGRVPDAAADGFLGLEGYDVGVTFTNGGTIDVALGIDLEQKSASGGWEFADSFPELRGLPYDIMPLGRRRMLFASAEKGATKAGLNFGADLALTGPFGNIAMLIGGRTESAGEGANDGGEPPTAEALAALQSTPFTITGLLRGTPRGLEFDLRATLNVASKPLGDIIELKDLFAGALYTRFKGEDGVTRTLTALYLGANVFIEGRDNQKIGFDIRAILPVVESLPTLTLSVIPIKGFETTLGKIGRMVAGQSWDGFFIEQAAPLKKLLDIFGLQSFSVNFSLKSFKVTTIQLLVGTLESWQPVQSWPEFKVDLAFDWMILFGRKTQMMATFGAYFQFSKDLSFDLEISVPNLRIAGTQHGMLPPLTLAALTGHALSIPEDLLTVQFGNFSISIETAIPQFSIGAEANLDLRLFGAEIFALRNTTIVATITGPSSSRTYVVQVDGEVVLGPITMSVSATIGKGVDTVFRMHLVNETIGSMLGHFVRLVDPTFEVRLESPWDRLLAISLDALVLEVNLTQKSMSLSYPLTIDLGFMKITGISLSYSRKKPGAPGGVQVELSGTFLNQTFGENGAPPLGWDPINEKAPQVPGLGDKLFDLSYLGFGQHITFGNLDKLETIGEVMAALQASVIPTDSELPKFGPDGLRFSRESGWLIGADFTVMGAVSLSVIFNDPNVYGLRVGLAGPKVKALAGLSFEILYRKVTDSIGLYHIELQVPDAFRELTFGQVQITLPIIGLDIYTNGNFRVDMGFPKGLDFSRSFGLQILPFIGYGGFYFALLNGDTSKRVPRITNGTFSPVIEFGLALAIGVGRTINKSVFSGGISVTVVGILEGVIGWFNPNDAATPKEEYYWLQGTIAIVGKLYGSVDFVVVKASVNVTAYASVTLVIEAHQPILITLSAGVSVSVSVKIVFFTIHLSFSAQIEQSFTIGSATPTPWKVASNGPPRKLMASAAATHEIPRGARFTRMSAVLRAEAALRLTAGEPPLAWDPVAVFPGGTIETLDLYPLPAFTKSETEAEVPNAVLLFCVESSIDPGASSPSQLRATAGDGAAAEINRLLEGLLRWAIYARRKEVGSTVTSDDLAALHAALADRAELHRAVTYETLSPFLGANFTIHLQAPPQTNEENRKSVAIFPAVPDLTVTTNDSHAVKIDFGNCGVGNPVICVDADYQRTIDAYFAKLEVQYRRNVAGRDPAAETENAALLEEKKVTITTIMFEQYFGMLLKAAVQAAGDGLLQLGYTGGDAAFSLETIARWLSGDTEEYPLPLHPMQVVSPNQKTGGLLSTGVRIPLRGVRYQVRLGDTFASIAERFTLMHTAVDDGAGVRPEDLFERNVDAAGIFNAGVQLRMEGFPYVSRENDTLNLIATRIMMRTPTTDPAQGLLGITEYIARMVAANAGLEKGADDPLDPETRVSVPPIDGTDAGTIYISVTGDTLARIAGTFLGMARNAVSFPQYAAALIEKNGLPPTTDPAKPLAPGTKLLMPAVPLTIRAADSVRVMADRLITTPDVVRAVMFAYPPKAEGNEPAATPLLTPQAVLDLPRLAYTVQADDSFAGIAGEFDLTIEALAEGLDPAAPIFAPKAAVKIADVAEIAIDTLMEALLGRGDWNNIAGMASRFMLSGLRLPDPACENLRALAPGDMDDVENHAAIATKPLYVMTGQQFPIDAPPPAEYAITMKGSGTVKWLKVGSENDGISGNGGGVLAIGLDDDQRKLLATIAATPLDPDIRTLTRLALYQMVPSSFTLQRHFPWQAAALPAGSCLDRTTTGNPGIWLFPDPLIERLAETERAWSTGGGDDTARYQLVVGTHEDATRPIVTTDVGCYTWGTLLTLNLRRPPGSAPGIKNSYLVTGADQNGRDLLQQLTRYLRDNPTDGADLFLLYSPSPAGASTTGLISDKLDTERTFLLKTNLSTLSHNTPPPLVMAKRRAAAAADAPPASPVESFGATIADARAFLKLLWECSVVQSGGYYLSYVNTNGGAGLPDQLFSDGEAATVSLLVMLTSQYAPDRPRILPLHNCAVVGDNIDATRANVFARPVTYVVQNGDTLATVTAWFRKYDPACDVATVAAVNAAIPLLLRVGATLQVPKNGGGTTSRTIAYGDTLASIAAAAGTDVATIAAIPANQSTPFLRAGAQAQLTEGLLRPHATVPAGNIGFELSRGNPDPETNPVAALFHLLGYRVDPTDPSAGGPGFIASGVGLPVGPSNDLHPGSDGNLPDASQSFDQTLWNYHRVIPVTPFARSTSGSLSPALPPAAENPFAGVGTASRITVALDFQDIFGNDQPIAPPKDAAKLPVGYYTDIVALGRWPGVAADYLVEGDRANGAPPVIRLRLTMQTDKYLPTTTLSLAQAQTVANGDATAYRPIYYQMRQPDFAMTLETSLDPAPRPLPLSSFNSFVDAVWIFLEAIGSLEQFVHEVTAPETAATIAEHFGVEGSRLFAANADASYAGLFGAATIDVPRIYTTLRGDSLQSIATQLSTDPLTLATGNAGIELSPGAVLATPQRTIASADGMSLRLLGSRFQCTAEGIAVGNATRTDILRPGSRMSADLAMTPLAVTDATATAPIVVTSAAHALPNGTAVEIVGVFGNAAANGTWTITVVDADTFTLDGSDGTEAGAYQSGGGVTVLSCRVEPGDSFVSMAGKISTAMRAATPITVAALARTNPATARLLLDGVSLTVADLVVAGSNPSQQLRGDSLASLAVEYARWGFTPEALVTLNAGVADLYSTGTALYAGKESNPVPPEQDDTLASFARRNGVSVESLGAWGGTATFVAGAKPAIPGLVHNRSEKTWSAYARGAGESLGAIAAKYAPPGAERPVVLDMVGTIAGLNPDIEGLLAAGRTVADPGSGKSVTTDERSTFASIRAAFRAQGVDLTIGAIAGLIADEAAMLRDGGVWLAPPMLAASAEAGHAADSLTGLAAKYNLDPLPLAKGNQAVHGFLKAGVALVAGDVTVTTGADDTLLSIAARFTRRGVPAGTPADTAWLLTTFGGQKGLLNPASLVVPAPIVTTLDIPISPDTAFPDPIFPITADVVMARDPNCVDPDFRDAESVRLVRTSVAPRPDVVADRSGSGLSLVAFANGFQQAYPGLRAATGKAASEFDDAGGRRLWAVNFGYGGEQSAKLDYRFGGGEALRFFAIPPLSTSLISGTADIPRYVRGGELADGETLNFQSVDLDTWAASFLEAVDLFLSTPYATPAWAIDRKNGTRYVDSVVAAKRRLAEAIRDEVDYILTSESQGDDDGSAITDAKETMLQSLLIRLSNAYTVNSLVQAPVAVASGSGTADLAPRLSGKLVSALRIAGVTAGSPIAVTVPGHRLANGAKVTIAGVDGVEKANGDWTITAVGADTFTLDGSSGSGTYTRGTGTVTPTDIRLSDYSFSTAKVPLATGSRHATFLLTVKSPAQKSHADLLLRYAINELERPSLSEAMVDGYQASSWLTFITDPEDARSTIGPVSIPIPLRAYPAPITLLDQSGTGSVPQPRSADDLVLWNYDFTWQHESAAQDRARLRVEFGSSGGGAPRSGLSPAKRLFAPLARFVAVYAEMKADLTLLADFPPGTPSPEATNAVKIFAQLVGEVTDAWCERPPLMAARMGQAIVYEYDMAVQPSDTRPALTICSSPNNPGELWPKVELYDTAGDRYVELERTTAGNRAVYAYPVGTDVTASLRQRFTFPKLNIFELQEGWAGMSITRNAALIGEFDCSGGTGPQTNPKFIYRTPMTGFSGVAIPYITATSTIPLDTTKSLAVALRIFFKRLFVEDVTTPASRAIRLACNYSFRLGAGGAGGDGLTPLVPVILVPSWTFDPAKDWDETRSDSFVSMLAAAVTEWERENNPSKTHGEYFFDLSVFTDGSASSVQPLIAAPYISYALGGR